MSGILQNPNQFVQTPFLGQPDNRPNYNSFTVLLNPDSVFTDFQTGTWLKLIAAAGDQIIVDAADPTDEVFGVIPFVPKKQTYAAGETVQIFGAGCGLYLMSSEAIDRGEKLEFLNTGGTPTVAPVSGANTVCAIALSQVSAANSMIRVLVQPGPAITS